MPLPFWFFDFTIYSFLILDIALILYLKRKQAEPVSAKVNIFVLFAIIAWGIIFYGSFLEPKFIQVNYQHVDFREDPKNNIVLAVISDFHVGPYKNEIFVLDVIDILNEVKPDAILLAGDFVYKNAKSVTALGPLGNITSVYPTYAVTGNHEYDLPNPDKNADENNSRLIQIFLEGIGVQFLNNDSIELKDNFWLAGTEEVWSHKSDIQLALKNRPLSIENTILLSHNPEIKKLVTPSQKINLILAGHTHGGQIRLPLIGPVPKIPHDIGQKYDKGWFDEEDTKIFITSGIGESGPRARLLNPPEIVILDVHY